MPTDFIRPRLVLVTTALSSLNGEAAMAAALAGGDVASVILDPSGFDDEAFQVFAERLVPLIQDAGAAAIICDDTRCAGRVKADGIHLTGGDLTELGDSIERFSPRLIVGASGFNRRHEALEAGERLPDYLFFGRFGGDDADAAHEKNLAMGEWWADLVEIPCIVMGGGDVESVTRIAETGAEFIALSAAVFKEPQNAGRMVSRANALIKAYAESEAA